MENNMINIKTIRELSDFGFFIPKYQRGYRWKEQQVEDLLNDIDSFDPERTKTWYCLQPLVVKECKEQNLDSSRIWFEVVDGQQRLTTIYLIGHYINEMWRGKGKDPEIQLIYETRKKSSHFLKQLETINDDVEVDHSNIDYYHISSAYKTINDWVKKPENKSFKKDSFIDKFLNNTKVIWYESKETDAITIFTRINMGKIPLTNAELIKALFLNLNSSNSKDADSEKTRLRQEKIRLKQLQIANEWDRIEYALQNSEFWYFINESENDLPTRIEFVLDLMSDKPNDADEYYTFRYFSNKFKHNSKEENREDEITKNWDEIKQYFQTLEAWFCDRELYHKIGFLISTGEKIDDLLECSKDSTKTDFRGKIDAKISEKVNVNLDSLGYRDAKKVRRVLLLHNIQSMLDNKSENSRFPFDRYKNEKWDVEHIHSVQEEMPSKEQHQKDWIKAASEFIIDDEGLKGRAGEFDKDGDFDTLYKDILNYFNGKGQHEEIDDISNLALLDSGTNRGYKNAVFPVKRKTIIEKDSSGTFIPLCTKKVFMKYYNLNVLQMTFWDQDDRQNYLDDIKKVLRPYMTNKNEEK